MDVHRKAREITPTLIGSASRGETSKAFRPKSEADTAKFGECS